MMDYRLPEIGLILKGSQSVLAVNDDRIELKRHDGSTQVWHRHDLGDNVGFFLGRSDYYREDRAFVEASLKGNRTASDFTAASNVDRIISQAEELVKNV